MLKIMTGEQFQKWLQEMKTARIGTTKAACGRLLGVSKRSVMLYQVQGCDLKTALACRALLHRLEPYS